MSMSGFRTAQKVCRLSNSLQLLQKRISNPSSLKFCCRNASVLSTVKIDTRKSWLGEIQPASWCISRGYAKKEKGSKGGIKKITSLPNPEDVEEIFSLSDYETELQQVLDGLKDDYIHRLNLRTNITSFESIEVSTEDGTFPLNQIALLAMKSPQLLVINATKNFQYVKDIQLAIVNSGLNVSPQIEANVISVPIPKITMEHRKNLIKNAKTLLNKAKEDLKRVRRKYHKLVAEAKETEEKDLCIGAENLIQHHLDQATQEATKIFEKKEKELMS